MGYQEVRFLLTFIRNTSIKYVKQLCNEVIARLKANKTKETITCVGKVLGTSPILEMLDDDNKVSVLNTHQTLGQTEIEFSSAF